MRTFKTLLILVIIIISNNLFAQLTVSETHQDCLCNGDATGSIDITVSGGTPPYTYNWETTNGYGIVATDEDQTNLSAGTYNCTVTDDASNEEYISITINEYAPLEIVVDSINNVTCNGFCDGSIYISASGGVAPYYYNWSIAPFDLYNGNLCAGDYWVTIADSIGCTITGNNFTITEPNFTLNINDSVNASNGVCNGSIDIDIIDGTAPFSFNWNTGDTTEDLNNLCAGNYSITVSDSNNCEINNSYIIENEYDSTITSFVDTISVAIDTCLFNTSIPIDSANIYDFEIISADSAITNWVFWQAGTATYFDITVPYSSGTNLIYLEIICLNKSTNIYKFYGIFNSESVDVSKVKKIIKVEIYPNPAKNFANIIVNNYKLSKISIIDISGKILKSEKFNSIIKIETKDFEKGIYIFKIETDNEVITKRILID